MASSILDRRVAGYTLWHSRDGGFIFCFVDTRGLLYRVDISEGRAEARRVRLWPRGKPVTMDKPVKPKPARDVLNDIGVRLESTQENTV